MSFPDDVDLVALQEHIRETQVRWDEAADQLIKEAFKKGLKAQELYDRTVERGRALNRTIETDTNKLQIVISMMSKLHEML